MEEMKLLENLHHWRDLENLLSEEMKAVTDPPESREYREKMEVLSRIKEDAHAHYMAAMELSEQVQDPVVKRIIQLKYIVPGKRTWKKVAHLMGPPYTEDNIRHLVARALRQLSKKSG